MCYALKIFHSICRMLKHNSGPQVWYNTEHECVPTRLFICREKKPSTLMAAVMIAGHSDTVTPDTQLFVFG
jgi:hypothetical protein